MTFFFVRESILFYFILSWQLFVCCQGRAQGARNEGRKEERKKERRKKKETSDDDDAEYSVD